MYVDVALSSPLHLIQLKSSALADVYRAYISALSVGRLFFLSPAGQQPLSFSCTMLFGLSASEAQELLQYFDCIVVSDREPDMQGFLVRFSCTEFS